MKDLPQDKTSEFAGITNLSSEKSLLKILLCIFFFICWPIFKIVAAHTMTNLVLVKHCSENILPPSKKTVNYPRKSIIRRQNQHISTSRDTLNKPRTCKNVFWKLLFSKYDTK